MAKSKIEAMLLRVIRDEYKIPECYDVGFFMPAGDNPSQVQVVFDFCDEDITVNITTGKATRTHMGLNASCDGHEFVTHPWEPPITK